MPKNLGVEKKYAVLVAFRPVDNVVLFDKHFIEKQVVCEICMNLQKKINKQKTRNRPLQEIKLLWLIVVLNVCIVNKGKKLKPRKAD